MRTNNLKGNIYKGLALPRTHALLRLVVRKLFENSSEAFLEMNQFIQMTSLAWVATLALLAMLLSSCGAGPNFGYSNPLTVTSNFATIQSQILMPSCGSCHSPPQIAGGVDVTSYQSLMASPGAISPYQPYVSELYKQTYNGTMPRKAAPLTAAQLQAIYNWIALGAPNN